MGEAVGGARAAFMRMVQAHIALAKAELGVVGTELGIIAGLAFGALAIAILAAILLYVGSFLFFGEWLFGSMGWGIIHGLLVAVAFITFVGLNLAGGDISRYGWGAAAGFVVAVVLAVLILSNSGSEAAGWVARQVNEGDVVIGARAVAMDIGFVIVGVLGAIAAMVLGAIIERVTDAPFAFSRPLVLFGFVAGGVAGMVVVPDYFDGFELAFGQEWVATWLGFGIFGLIGALVALIAAWRQGLRDGPLVGATIAGFVLLGFIGAIYASTRYQAVDGVLGFVIMIGLLTWIGVGAALTARHGFDPEGRYANLIPVETIAALEKTKEYVASEWKRQLDRMLGR